MPKYLNRFKSPTYIEETIENEEGLVGKIRVKPSSILWKPKGAQKFFSVPLDTFVSWITDKRTDAAKTSS